MGYIVTGTVHDSHVLFDNILKVVSLASIYSNSTIKDVIHAINLIIARGGIEQREQIYLTETIIFLKRSINEDT
jgi:hypothetical protein